MEEDRPHAFRRVMNLPGRMETQRAIIADYKSTPRVSMRSPAI
jgi:hypothetical protein